jgi:hypothetical protein
LCTPSAWLPGLKAIEARGQAALLAMPLCDRGCYAAQPQCEPRRNARNASIATRPAFANVVQRGSGGLLGRDRDRDSGKVRCRSGGFLDNVFSPPSFGVRPKTDVRSATVKAQWH